MKKLITATVITCTAVISQAAAVDWNYADTSADSSQVGYTVYCIAGAIQETWSSVDAVKAAALTDGAAVVVARKRTTETGDVTSYGSALTRDSGYYFVVVNDTEDKFGVIAGDKSLVYDPQAQETSPGTSNFNDVAVTSSFSSDPGPIPEPTSGLLMLLGVAGLALRRKQQ